MEDVSPVVAGCLVLLLDSLVPPSSIKGKAFQPVNFMAQQKPFIWTGKVNALTEIPFNATNVFNM